MDEPILDLMTTTRSYFNFYKLSYYDRELFEKMDKTIAKQIDKLSEEEMVNVMRCSAYNNHVNEEILDKFLRRSIDHSDMLSFKGIANICYSLAQLGIRNKTLF